MVSISQVCHEPSEPLLARDASVAPIPINASLGYAASMALLITNGFARTRNCSITFREKPYASYCQNVDLLRRDYRSLPCRTGTHRAGVTTVMAVRN